MTHSTEPLTVGVNIRFDGVSCNTVCERIAFYADGTSKNVTSRQELRRAKRQGEKALMSQLKQEARALGRAGGGAAIVDRKTARVAFADILARGEKPIKNIDRTHIPVPFKHPWQR